MMGWSYTNRHIGLLQCCPIANRTRAVCWETLIGVYPSGSISIDVNDLPECFVDENDTDQCSKALLQDRTMDVITLIRVHWPVNRVMYLARLLASFTTIISRKNPVYRRIHTGESMDLGFFELFSTFGFIWIRKRLFQIWVQKSSWCLPCIFSFLTEQSSSQYQRQRSIDASVRVKSDFETSESVPILGSKPDRSGTVASLPTGDDAPGPSFDELKRNRDLRARRFARRSNPMASLWPILESFSVWNRWNGSRAVKNRIEWWRIPSKWPMEKRQ